MDANAKLSLIKGNLTPQQVRIRLFTSAMDQFIKEAPTTHYTEATPFYAQQILSSCPFASDSHLCKAFKVSADTLKQWVIDHEELSDAIALGKAEGEALCRDMMLELSAEPSSSINTQLIKILSQNVYDIKDEHNLNLATPEALKWDIQIVDMFKEEVKDER